MTCTLKCILSSHVPVLLFGTLALAHLGDTLMIWWINMDLMGLHTGSIGITWQKKELPVNKTWQAACSVSSLWLDLAISIFWQLCPHPTSNSESHMHVHGHKYSCVQSAPERLGAAAGGQAGAPSCDVTANDSKWVGIFTGADRQLPEGKRWWFTPSAVLLFLKWIEFVITAFPPRPHTPSFHCSAEKTAKSLLGFSWYPPHDCAHTYRSA